MLASFVSQVNTGTARIQNATYQIPKPPGLAVGDGMFAWLDSANGAITLTSAPSGWNVAVDERWGGVGYRRIVAWKIADAADVAASTFDFVWSASATGEGFIAAYRDIDPAKFFTISAISDVGKESPGPGGSITLTCPSVVTIAPNSLVLRVVVFQGFNVTDDGAITEEVGHTERLDLAVPDNARTLGFQENDTPQAAEGPTGTQDVTGTDLDAGAGSPDYRTEAWTLAIGSPLAPGSGGIMGSPGVVGKKPVTKADVLAAREHAKAIGAKVKTKFDPRTRR